MTRANRVVVDLGTGDGRAVLARAVREPDSFVIGIDANAAAMREASRRAYRGRTRVPNACFLVEAAERLPGPLAAKASLVTVTFPWGSLLRGALGLDRSAMSGIASLVAPFGCVEVLASVVPSDRVDGVSMLDLGLRRKLADEWQLVGLEVVSMRRVTGEELIATRSSWARRLGHRPAWRLELRRCDRLP